jgi:hypothetical protein
MQFSKRRRRLQHRSKTPKSFVEPVSPPCQLPNHTRLERNPERAKKSRLLAKAKTHVSTLQSFCRLSFDKVLPFSYQSGQNQLFGHDPCGGCRTAIVKFYSHIPLDTSICTLINRHSSCSNNILKNPTIHSNPPRQSPLRVPKALS